jgi:hypothetical protein
MQRIKTCYLDEHGPYFALFVSVTINYQVCVHACRACCSIIEETLVLSLLAN